ncbi:hypothetical protein EXIGLDRAFT_748065 [Exidia glandulosa HHB12029]|uniref:Micro-fibrillar-associated protein 1 C-terminal domain-containing protein n=1 Tax=Exidia glandulosa HHB12029 TaxID=1314781 RepID=A0A165K0C0_EXIGL|nr:hypothetical protein EXIGLDRAFT_748065 [Exidia glandulosa HHB12029]
MSLATERRPKAAARLARPAKRYRPGKLPEGVKQLADSDDDDEEEQPDDDAEPGDVPIGGSDDEEEDEDLPLPQQGAPVRAQKKMNLALRDVNVTREGKVTVAGKLEVGRTGAELEEESEEEESDEEVKPGAAEPSSEEESSEEEDDAPPVPAFRPVFVPKRARDTVAAREADYEFSEEAIRKRELEAEERKKQSYEMVADSIKRELAEKETKELQPDVDDTDGLDPTGEFEAWRLRELARIKRDKEEELRKEEERLEVERRRALPEEQRLKEDLEHAQKLRDEKPKGQQKFLQKYWHKGAFHQDEDILQKHDYTEATESTVDVSMLPKVMQKKNFGKRSQTKYTHLLDQDTTVGSTGFGAAAGKPGASSSGCFHCGGPHLKKDCPQLAHGANDTTLGTRRDMPPPQPPSSWKDRDRDRDRDGDRYRERDNGYGARGGGGGRDRRGIGARPSDRDRDGDRGYGGRDHERDKERYRESERRDRRRSRSRSRERDRRRSRSRSASPSFREKRRRLD